MRYAICVMAVMLSACASQPPKVAATTWPQAVINTSKQDIREHFLAKMASAGASIERSSDSVIEARIPDENAFMAKAFFGCPSCADPYIKVNMIFATVGGGTQVVVQYWRMIPKANGSEERHEIESNADFNQWQQGLWSLRDQYQ